jgi:hypothetical protein
VCDATTRNPGFTSGERLTDDDSGSEAHWARITAIDAPALVSIDEMAEQGRSQNPFVGIQGGLQWLARYHVAR